MGFLDFFRRKKKKLPEQENRAEEVYKVLPGLALSGGGTRGFGHIGAIRAFEENGVDFKYIAGTSAGSIIGALYAAGFTSAEMLELTKTLREKDIRTSKLIWVPSRSSNVEAIMRRFLGDVVFSDLTKPFACVAVDMKAGREVTLSSGSVPRAISASCAVPGVFTPVLWQDYVLQDGGLMNSIPSDVAREMGAEKVVSVDINSTRGYGTESTHTFDLLMASLRISMKSAALKGYANSDIVIQPDLKKFKSTKLDGIAEMVQAGYDATMEKMDEIKELLGLKRHISTLDRNSIRSVDVNGGKEKIDREKIDQE